MAKQDTAKGEIVEADEAAATPSLFNGVKVTGKKVVALPLLKTVMSQPVHVVFLSGFYNGKKIDDKDPATLARVIDASDEKVKELILGAVLLSQLEESYPGGAHKGKAFELVKLPKEGKDYNPWEINEISFEGVDFLTLPKYAEYVD